MRVMLEKIMIDILLEVNKNELYVLWEGFFKL